MPDRYIITGSVWIDGTRLKHFNLADSAVLNTDREATQLLDSYIACLLIQGGTATFSQPYDEYKVVMPDGSAEYISWPVKVDANNRSVKV